MANGNMIVKAGSTGVALTVGGASVAAASSAIVIVATASAIALVLIGYGLFKRLSR